MDDQNWTNDPGEIISQTYEDLSMAEIVDWDKYEEMLWDETEEHLNDLLVELIEEDEDLE